MIPRYAPVPRSREGSGGGASSGRPRGLALLVAALALMALVLGTGVVVRPLWWRLKADLSEHGPAGGGAVAAASGKPTPQTAAARADRERLMATAAEAMGVAPKAASTPAMQAVRMDNRAGVPPTAAVKVAAAAKAKEEQEQEEDQEDDGAATEQAPLPAAAGGGKAMDDAAREALRARIAKMTPEQLERAREQAREQQWDDEWWRQYQKVEATKREREKEKTAESEKRTVARFNLTLTESSAKALAHPDGGYVLVTWANAHYTDFALSWVEHLRACGLGDHLVVGAMDDPVLYSLAKRRIPAFAMQSGA